MNKKMFRQMYDLHFRMLKVVQTEQLNSTFKRIVFSGDFSDFRSEGFDDHIKLFFPDENGVLNQPTKTAEGWVFPENIKKPIARDYTPYYFDEEKNELTVIFVVHQQGIATNWAENAKKGDELLIAGPRGSLIVPMVYDAYVLIGDETALPAICRRLQELPADSEVFAFIELDSKQDELILTTEAKSHIVWVYRNGIKAESSSLLLEALANHPLPQGDFHTWIAAEKTVAKALRAAMLDNYAAKKEYMKSTAYWHKGKAGEHGSLDNEG